MIYVSTSFCFFFNSSLNLLHAVSKPKINSAGHGELLFLVSASALCAQVGTKSNLRLCSPTDEHLMLMCLDLRGKSYDSFRAFITTERLSHHKGPSDWMGRVLEFEEEEEEGDEEGGESLGRIGTKISSKPHRNLTVLLMSWLRLKQSLRAMNSLS